MPTLLLLDDEPGLRFGVARFLRGEGFEVLEAETVAGALEVGGRADLDLALVDFQLPDGDALEVMAGLRERRPDLPVVVLTGFGTVDLAVRALQAGADHFLTKPVELPALLAVLRRCLEGARNRKLAATSRRVGAVDPFVGTSAAIRELRAQAERAAQARLPVLLQGETGSGKGVLAKWLHQQGPRQAEAFVDLNCAGLSREFLESELFGHERGAFTGAAAPKEGLLELAHRGTVFLDEIGDLDLALQPKLLKALEEGRFRRLGATKERAVDVRLVAATHRDLQQAVGQERFRADLYFRLATVVLRIPPLRERREDLPDLVARMLPPIAAELGRPGIRLTPEALGSLQAHAWPGNLRELRNVLERSVLMAPSLELRGRDLQLPTPVALPMALPEDGEGDLRLEALEKAHVLRVMALVAEDVGEAARRLGIARSTLYQKLKLIRG